VQTNPYDEDFILSNFHLSRSFGNKFSKTKIESILGFFKNVQMWEMVCGVFWKAFFYDLMKMNPI
jgi:hypothetical protein